jgi:flagellar protein FlbD
MGAMVIQLTRLNNKPLFVNSDLIKYIEQSPDTVVTLISGEKLVVLETVEEISSRIVTFRRSVLHGLAFGWDPSPSVAANPKLADAGEREPER